MQSPFKEPATAEPDEFLDLVICEDRRNELRFPHRLDVRMTTSAATLPSCPARPVQVGIDSPSRSVASCGFQTSFTHLHNKACQLILRRFLAVEQFQRMRVPADCCG